MQIVKSYYDAVWDVVGETPLTVTKVRISPFYTTVALSNQHVGVAFTPRDLSDTERVIRNRWPAPRLHG
jgi:hypothetical protein